MAPSKLGAIWWMDLHTGLHILSVFTCLFLLFFNMFVPSWDILAFTSGTQCASDKPTSRGNSLHCLSGDVRTHGQNLPGWWYVVIAKWGASSYSLFIWIPISRTCVSPLLDVTASGQFILFLGMDLLRFTSSFCFTFNLCLLVAAQVPLTFYFPTRSFASSWHDSL